MKYYNIIDGLQELVNDMETDRDFLKDTMLAITHLEDKVQNLKAENDRLSQQVEVFKQDRETLMQKIKAFDQIESNKEPRKQWWRIV